jgi:hypothetical protein
LAAGCQPGEIIRATKITQRIKKPESLGRLLTSIPARHQRQKTFVSFADCGAIGATVTLYQVE